MANCQNDMRCTRPENMACQGNMMRQRNMMQQRPSCRCGMEPMMWPEQRRIPERKNDEGRRSMGEHRDMEERRMEERCMERKESPRCGCRMEEDCLQSLPIAMSYVPWQKWRNIYDVSKGFHRGTIFEELDKPFLGRGGCNR